VLEGPVSDRWAVVQTGAFLERLAATRPVGEAYLLPLVEPLAQRAEALDPVGLLPGRLVRLAETLRTAREAHSAVRESSAVRRAETALRRRAALLFGYAGATERAIACMAPQVDPEPLGSLPDTTPRERLAAARKVGAGTDGDEAVRWLLEHWDRSGDREDGATVPVVERLPSWARTDPVGVPRVGGLRHLHIQLYGPAEDVDQLRTDGAVRGGEDDDLTGTPVTAARRLLNRRFAGIEGQFVSGRLVFDRRQYTHEGQSAGLAIAALFYGAVLRHTRRRQRLQVRPETVLTGDVSPDGTVLPVAEKGLRVKVQTAFFSPKTCLVVPEAQEEAAEDARAELLDDFPHGHLDVVGIDQLDALFYDRRLTHLERIGWTRHTAQRLWDRRGAIGAGTLITALLLVITALLYGPLDKNPVTIDFAGTEMVLKNESGRVLERIEVHESLPAQVSDSDYNKPYRLGELDGDGRNEVCWEARPEEGPQQLRCKGIGEDTPQWSRTISFDISLPRKPAVQSGKFGTNHIRIGDFDANGRPEVIATFSHKPYFPFLVLKLDPTTGEELGRYLHPGYLNSPIVAADLNGDGPKELLLTGVSNAYNQAVFVALDSRFIQGHGPTRGDYLMEGMPKAREVAYLRIPPTIVTRAQPNVENNGKVVRVDKAKKQLRLEVYDGIRPSSEGGQRRSRILIHLNYELDVLGIGTSTRYDYLSEWLVEQGRMEELPDYDYFQRYKQKIQYWTGSGWAREPTLNERWKTVGPSDTSRAVPDASSRRP